MIITRKYALAMLRKRLAMNPCPLRPDDQGRVYVALDVYHPRKGWIVHHYLERKA